MSLKERFSANLRSIRRRAGLTQEELAEMTEMHRTEISYLENAKRAPRIETLVKLVCALECSADELIEGMAWKPNLGDYGRWVVADG
ncbi:MAG TPA: helix-turn-helix transcriptional regulator [Solirubrobacterales bacterium]|nr:helix-turn-helix transcriptional regulator [Solirubrobacterales bacterium]